jgi:hypothetical protein
MTRIAQTAYRLRTWLLIVGLLFELAALAWAVSPEWWQSPSGWEPAGLLGTPLCLPDPPGWSAYLLNVLIVVGLLMIAQWVFLRPRDLFAVRLTSGGRPLKSAVIVAAAMGMLLTLGLFALVLELLGLWQTFIAPVDYGPALSSLAGIWAGMIGVWLIWAVLLFRYWRDGDRYTHLGRVVRALVAGSLLEAVVAAPVQAFASRQHGCYCDRGSYTTLICAGAVLFWAFGPGMVLLFMRESYRRMRLFPHCQKCGYDLRGASEVCPECGTATASMLPNHAQPTV